MENGERGESRGIVKTARRILVVTSAKQRPLGRIFSMHSPSIRPGLRTNKVSICRKTHKAQKHPRETQDLVEKFIVTTCPFFLQSNQDKRFIINMDQTPIFFSMVPNTMLNHVGDQSVNVCSSSGSTMCETVALTVTAAGGLLPPMFVFKAKPGGRVQQELRNFPEGAVYTVQHNAWMDKIVMLQWVDRVLKPWSETMPESIVPYLLCRILRLTALNSLLQYVN